MMATNSDFDYDVSLSEKINRNPSATNRNNDTGNLHSPKLSLSAYETQRSFTASGEETPHDQDAERNETLTKKESGPKTSTPNRPDLNINAVNRSVGFSPVRRRETVSSIMTNGSSGEGDNHRKRRSTIIDPLDVRVPLVGFEVMEQRSKFTVFKLHVHKGHNDNWFVFRRYTDFVQLQQKIKKRFPMFRLALPPKRWFRDNYEKDFLDDRMLGLQAFVDSVLCHSDLCNCGPVQEFFCFSDPPGPHDSVEESRAYCDDLEDSVYNLKKECHAKDVEIELLREELGLYKRQVEMLTQALREANANGATTTTHEASVPSPASSLAECDLLAPEVDQSKPMSLKDEIIQSEAKRLREEGHLERATQEGHAKPNLKSDSSKPKEKNRSRSSFTRILPSS